MRYDMDISNCMYDYLPGTDIYYYQHPQMFHVNTDTALLGHFMTIRKKDTVMDIGCNNGALLLYAMRHHPKHLIGVEINEEACALARYNLDLHQQHDAEIIHANILELFHDPVSCIVCNPPYFQMTHEKQLNINEHLSRARHEVHLDLKQLIFKISTLLHDKGRLYMVHRADRMIDLALYCREANMEIKKLQFVYDLAKADARSVLIEAMKQGKPHCKILSPVTINHT